MHTSGMSALGSSVNIIKSVTLVLDFYQPIFVYLHVCVYMYVHVYVCMCVCVYVYICICVCVYLCTCVHVYARHLFQSDFHYGDVILIFLDLGSKRFPRVQR